MKLSIKIFLVITFLTTGLLLVNGGLIIRDSFQQELMGAKKTVIATNRLIANQLWQSDQQQVKGLSKNQVINLTTVTHTNVVIANKNRQLIYEKGIDALDERELDLKNTDRQQVQFFKGKNNFVAASLQVKLRQHTYYITSVTRINAIINNRNRLIQKIWLYLAFSILINLLLTYFIMQRLLKPVRLLKSSSQHFQENIHEFKPLTVKGNDELADLTKSFNLMALTIKQNLKTAEEQALIQKRFSRSLTHEINTPLTIILGYAELLQRNNLDENRKQEALDYIIDESSRLQELGSRITQLIQYEHVQPHFELQPTKAIAGTVKQIITGIKHQSSKQFDVIWDLSSAELQIDQPLFKEMIINLFDNAVQSLPKEGGCLKLVGRQTKNVYRLQLIDNGKGIDPQMLGKIFDPFISGKNFKGNHLGLGLAITRQIIASLNWKIWIENRISNGTRVTIEIPIEVKDDES